MALLKRFTWATGTHAAVASGAHHRGAVSGRVRLTSESLSFFLQSDFQATSSVDTARRTR